MRNQFSVDLIFVYSLKPSKNKKGSLNHEIKSFTDGLSKGNIDQNYK